MSVAENIKKLRELKNFTQSYMASQLDMSVSGYSKIENGRTDITLSKVKAIAKILETKLTTILNFDSQKIFNNYENSFQTGLVNNSKTGRNINQLLQNIQEDINGLKKSMKRNT